MYRPIDSPIDVKLTTEPPVQTPPAPDNFFPSRTASGMEIITTSFTPSFLSCRLKPVQQDASPGRQSQPLNLSQASSSIARHLKEIWLQSNFSETHWHYLALGALLLSLPTGVSLAAFQAIATPPKTNCNQPKQFRADLAQLQCLHQAMESGETQAVIQALPQLQAWPSDSPVHSVAQRLLQDWSVVALSMAHREFEAGQWDSAARLAQAIPTELALGNQAQGQISLWQQIKEQGDHAYQKALDALEQQDWIAAQNHAQTLANLSNDYWRQQGLKALPQKINEALQAQQPQGKEAQISAVPADLHQSTHPSQARMSKQANPTGRSRKAMPILMGVASLTITAPAPTRPEFSVI